jgi:hypothetical protein
MMLLRRGVEQDLRTESQENIEEARMALHGFIKVNGRFPYAYNPGSTAVGKEGNTSYAVGYLPFDVLGINPSDSWHRPLLYVANSSLQFFFRWNPPPSTPTIIERARTSFCASLNGPYGFFKVGYYPAFEWPWIEDPAISASPVPAAGLLISGGAQKNGNANSFYDVKTTNRRDNNTTNPGSSTMPPTNTFIRPLPGTVLPSGGVYDDILVTFDPATLYKWALCSPPLP